MDEIRQALPENDKFRKATITRSDLGKKRELSLIIADRDVTPELKAQMKELGFEYSDTWATYGSGEIKGLARFYSKAGSINDVKDLYAQLYQKARNKDA